MRDFRSCKKAEELSHESQQQASRGLKWYYDADGKRVIKARLPAESSQMFIRAIEAAKDEISDAHVSGGTPAEISAETPNVKSRQASPTRKADALTTMAESFLAQGAATLKGGDRHQNVVHVEACLFLE